MAGRRGWKFLTEPEFNIIKDMLNDPKLNTSEVRNRTGKGIGTLLKIKQSSDFNEYRVVTRDYSRKYAQAHGITQRKSDSNILEGSLPVPSYMIHENKRKYTKRGAYKQPIISQPEEQKQTYNDELLGRLDKIIALLEENNRRSKAKLFKWF